MSAQHERLDLNTQLDELFALDAEVAANSPELLPLDSPDDLRQFLEVEHTSETYAWRNEANELVGSISLCDHADKDALEILNIGVNPAAQRGGYGRAMLEFAESQARSLSRKKIVLVTGTMNTQAINFYTKYGFTIVETIENVYDDGKPRFLLEKSL